MRVLRSRVVSMPSWTLFDKQSTEYRDSVLPAGVAARVAVEAGCALGWSKYVGEKGKVISLERFGASAPYQTILEHLGFTGANVASIAKSIVGK